MDFAAWLTIWLARHPLQGPPKHFDRAGYIADVMAKIRARELPVLSPAHRRLPWPRLVLAVATASAGLAVALHVSRSTGGRLAQQITHDSRLLASLDETAVEPLSGSRDEIETLTEDMQTDDALVLAESTPSDEQWIARTQQLLDQLDEGGGAADSLPADPSDQDWLNELEWLDERDLVTTS